MADDKLNNVDALDNQFSLPQDALEELRTEFITAGGIVTSLPDVSTVRDNTQVQIKKVDANGNTRFDLYQMIDGKWYFLTDVDTVKLHAEGSSEQYETDEIIAIAMADTIYEVDSGWSNHYLHQMGNGDGSFKILLAGDYHLSWTLAFHSAGANNNYACGLLIDGVNVEIAWSHTHTQSTGDIAMMGASTLYRLKAGQEVSLGVKNIGGTDDLIIDHASFTVFRIR